MKFEKAEGRWKRGRWIPMMYKNGEGGGKKELVI